MTVRPSHALWLLLAVALLGCSTVAHDERRRGPSEDQEVCRPSADAPCVAVQCTLDVCGLYLCEDVAPEVQPVRFPPARPPVAAAPGSGPRRNWGRDTKNSNGAAPVMVFPNWNGVRERAVPPSHQLPAGRFEKHHIFPQAELLARWFERQGVKIHNYTLPIPRDLHRRIHGGDGRGGAWNQAWRDFMLANPRATPEEIYRHAGALIYRFQLLGGPLQPYYSRPGT
ncbi:TIGR02269 family lipoprotein [Myxococcus sp. AM009]|uniref:SitA6 family polymorphic toxin lipoprotein n=1 Tax=Myxococcus sp. AM010 TaxID=2745138 RepID=UPI0015950E7E|nr:MULTISPECIES: TIGR02269 family lipoprotein [unclassified Myxococcus]NVJ02412.1 TIGR02269 family lipoprotein [Myxococcus sp. AM009]NVJ15418.1 TIGR02269 family lipoprotein [Myxococcus sp. AM010]